MKRSLVAAFAVVGLCVSTLSQAATVSVDFSALPLGNINPGSSVTINSFTSLSTDGFVSIGTPMFGGPGTVIGSAGSNAIFTFDTSTVAVTSISLTGASNNVPVTITSYDFAGDMLGITMTDNSWTSVATLTNSIPQSYFTVDLLESEINSLTITYDPVAAVPVPAAVWLFGSGLAGLLTVSRRRRS